MFYYSKKPIKKQGLPVFWTPESGIDPANDDWIKSSLSSFPTHQHRYASMERMRQAGQKWRREDPPAALATSPTGPNDLVGGGVERRPQAGTLQADGASRAVRDSLPGKRELAHRLKLLDGEDFAVDVVGGAAPVGAEECEGPVWGEEREGVVRHPPPTFHILLPGVQAPQEKIGNNEMVGGHGRLLSPSPAWSAARIVAVRGISDTHETRSRPLSKIILFASQDLISCLPACQSALSDKDLLDLSMKADIYISHMDAYVNRFRQFY